MLMKSIYTQLFVYTYIYTYVYMYVISISILNSSHAVHNFSLLNGICNVKPKLI